jgi:amidohydrolase
MAIQKKTRQEIIDSINSQEKSAIETASYIFDNPETGNNEFEASRYLGEVLEKNNFSVSVGAGGLPTAFKAEFSFKKPGPSVCFIAEYDALPGLGHACHHHIIASSAVNTAIALSRVEGLCGKIIVAGTPAEELMGAKGTLIKNGFFKDIDIAMMLHGGPENAVNLIMMALYGVEFTFCGKASHAAAAPHEGINALDAVIQLFNSISSLRQQLKEDVRIHGIITDGGRAVNIIPDSAAARFYIRTRLNKDLDKVLNKVKNCAKGAALQAGAELKINIYEGPCKDLLSNSALIGEYENNFTSLGGHLNQDQVLLGSSDAGDLSYFLPVLHPMIKTAGTGAGLHTEEFLDYGKSSIAYKSMMLGMKAIALTAASAMLDKGFLDSVKAEFKMASGIK